MAQIFEVSKISQVYGLRQQVGEVFGYKAPSRLLKEFRDYADDHERVFKPSKPYIKNDGYDTIYNLHCFAYFIEYKDLLQADSRSVPKYKDELPRLKAAYELQEG